MIEKTLNLVENVSTSQAYTVPENHITPHIGLDVWSDGKHAIDIVQAR